MSHFDSRRRRPFLSTSNNVHRLLDPFTFVDEEYVSSGIRSLLVDIRVMTVI